MVTHELSYLRFADLILIMSGGQITSEGSFTELSKSGAFAEFIEQCKTEQAAASVKVIASENEEYVTDDDDGTFVDDSNEVCEIRKI